MARSKHAADLPDDLDLPAPLVDTLRVLARLRQAALDLAGEADAELLRLLEGATADPDGLEDE